MKILFSHLFLLFFIKVHSQLNDSMEIETMRIASESQFDSDIVGNVLPDFTAKDLGGKIYTSNEVRGTKATFVNFWFVNCPPCIAEMPNLNRLYDMMKGSSEFQFFAITWEPEARARDAIEKYGIHFPVLLISPSEARQLTFGRGYPTSMIQDKEGKMHCMLSGGSLTPGNGFESYWKQEIDKVLKGDTLIEVSKYMQGPENKPGIDYIDSASKIQSLDELVYYFKKRPLFIDLWALWCLPCREEFNFKSRIDSFLNKHKIVSVYISVDDPKAKGAWKKVIYQHQLKGYHLLASDKLVRDLKEKIYKSEAIDLPRYILVKKGKIVELNALRPSDGQKLLEQLTEKLL